MNGIPDNPESGAVVQRFSCSTQLFLELLLGGMHLLITRFPASKQSYAAKSGAVKPLSFWNDQPYGSFKLSMQHWSLALSQTPVRGICQLLVRLVNLKSQQSALRKLWMGLLTFSRSCLCQSPVFIRGR